MSSEVPAEIPSRMPDTLEVEKPAAITDLDAIVASSDGLMVARLRTMERQIEREWWWLNGAIHATAQVRAERSGSDLHAFREMQAQAREVDRLRVQIAMRIAAIEASTYRGADPVISQQH